MTPDIRVRRLVDAHLEARITRRQFVEGALTVGLSVTGTAALVAACSRSRAPGTTSRPARLRGTVHIFGGFGTVHAPSQSAVQQALAEAFILIHPQVGIDFVGAATIAAARSQLTASIGSGAPPDLVLPLGLSEISRRVDQNTWLDLSPFLARDGLSLDHFLPATAPATRLSSYYGSKSKIVVGLPVGIHNHALAYNQDLFAKARIAVPPPSWSDSSWTLGGRFLEAAKACTLDTAGKHPGDPGFDPGRVNRFGLGRYRPDVVFYNFGGHFYDAATRRAGFAESGSMAGTQFAADLVNNFHVQPTPAQVVAMGGGGGKGNEEQLAWLSGRLAMIDMCSCEIRSPWAATTFPWKAAALPAGPARRFGFLELDLGAIPQASANHDLAWEVLKFFALDPANERRLSYDGFGAMPALKVNRDAFVQGLRTDTPKVDPTPFIAGLSSCSPENDEWVPAFSDLHDLATATFDRIIGGAGVAPEMQQLQLRSQAKIDAWFKAHRLPG